MKLLTKLCDVIFALGERLAYSRVRELRLAYPRSAEELMFVTLLVKVAERKYGSQAVVALGPKVGRGVSISGETECSFASFEELWEEASNRSFSRAAIESKRWHQEDVDASSFANEIASRFFECRKPVTGRSLEVGGQQLDVVLLDEGPDCIRFSVQIRN